MLFYGLILFVIVIGLLAYIYRHLKPPSRKEKISTFSPFILTIALQAAIVALGVLGNNYVNQYMEMNACPPSNPYTDLIVVIGLGALAAGIVGLRVIVKDKKTTSVTGTIVCAVLYMLGFLLIDAIIGFISSFCLVF